MSQGVWENCTAEQVVHGGSASTASDGGLLVVTGFTNTYPSDERYVVRSGGLSPARGRGTRRTSLGQGSCAALVLLLKVCTEWVSRLQQPSAFNASPFSLAGW